MRDASSSTSPQGPESQEQQAIESCCELHPPTPCGPTTCPACGGLGRPVKRLTLGALLKPAHRAQIPIQEEFCFCRTATCDVVYFRPQHVLFRKDDLAVPVGLKEPGNPTAPACYCFGWTPERIRAEIDATGNSTVIDQIKKHVKAGNCYCEVTNPQGACCLGNIASAVQAALQAAGTRARLRHELSNE